MTTISKTSSNANSAKCIKPVGILNSDCLVSVAKDTSISPNQAADTLLMSNIAAMITTARPPMIIALHLRKLFMIVLLWRSAPAPTELLVAIN